MHLYIFNIIHPMKILISMAAINRSVPFREAAFFLIFLVDELGTFED